MAKITVVIPLYNKVASINRAIGSVLSQSFKDIELIVVDDGSTDGSVQAIDTAFQDKILLIRQDNAGPGRARNVGAAAGQGEFLAFLDADDEWEPGFLASAHEVLRRHPECATYVSAYSSGAFRSVQDEILLRLLPQSGPRSVDGLLRPDQIKAFVDCFHSSACVVRRNTFELYGGYFDRDRCLYGEDSYFWIQVAFAGANYFDRTKNVHFHVEDSSLGVKLKNQHPRRPALLHPEKLILACPPQRLPILETLLAFYRLIETESLIRQRQYRDIVALRKAFHWPSGRLQTRTALRELRVSILEIMNRRHWRTTPPDQSSEAPPWH